MLEYKDIKISYGDLEMEKGTYSISFDFTDERSANDFFNKVANFVIMLDECNNALLSPFGTKIETNLQLQNLEFGSLRIIIKEIIEKIDDETIKIYCNNPNEILCDVLIKAKQVLLSSLAKEKRDFNYKEIIDNTELKDYGYTINHNLINKSISNLSKASLEFKTPPKWYIDNKQYTIENFYNYELKEQLEKQIHHISGNFLIKKHTLQGDSQWELIYDRVIKVKITDESFIQKIKNREILIGSGDKLDGIIEVISFVDENGKVVEREYTLKEVKRIL